MADTYDIYAVYEPEFFGPPSFSVLGYTLSTQAYHVTYIYVDNQTGAILNLAAGDPSSPPSGNLPAKIYDLLKSEFDVGTGRSDILGNLILNSGTLNDFSQKQIGNWLGNPDAQNISQVTAHAVPVMEGVTLDQWNALITAEQGATGGPYAPLSNNSNVLAEAGAAALGFKLPPSSILRPYWLPGGLGNNVVGALAYGALGIEFGIAAGFTAPVWATTFVVTAAIKYIAPHFEPLVFDLGSGIQTTTLQNGTFFDNQNNGFAENTAWVAANTGILVYDPTDGPITNGSQLFGTSTSLVGGGYAVDGFAALAAITDSISVVNSSSTDWSDLYMWIGGNGTPGSGTLETMSEAGIASISLTTTNTDTTDANGNYIGKTSTYSLVGGGTAEVADVSFQTNPVLTIPDTVVTESSDIQSLPDLTGYGTVTSLQQEMQIQANASDTTLEGYVESFAAATDDATRNTLVDEIIYQWTGVESVSSTSRGSYFNAQQLEALEAFSGQSFVDPYNSTANPGLASVAALTVAYNLQHPEPGWRNHVYERC